MRHAERSRSTTFPAVNLVELAYLVAGAVVASTHHYFAHVDTVRAVVSAILAIVLWPLLLFGIDLHIR